MASGASDIKSLFGKKKKAAAQAVKPKPVVKGGAEADADDDDWGVQPAQESVYTGSRKAAQLAVGMGTVRDEDMASKVKTDDTRAAFHEARKKGAPGSATPPPPPEPVKPPEPTGPRRWTSQRVLAEKSGSFASKTEEFPTLGGSKAPSPVTVPKSASGAWGRVNEQAIAVASGVAPEGSPRPSTQDTAPEVVRATPEVEVPSVEEQKPAAASPTPEVTKPRAPSPKRADPKPAEAAVAPESATPSANGKASPPPSPATTAPEDEEDEEVAALLMMNKKKKGTKKAAQA